MAVDKLDLSKRFGKQTAYYIVMYYAITQWELMELKGKIKKLLANKQIKAVYPELNIQTMSQFAAKLYRNAALWTIDPEDGSPSPDTDGSFFNNQDETIAYVVLLYMMASQDKKIYDLNRDLPHVQTELKQRVGVNIRIEDLIRFTAGLYEDTVHFVFQGQN